MKTIAFVASVLLLCAISASAAVPARVFLAGNGNDANDCTNIDTPCRSLQGAVDQCPVNGEVIIISSGGFGTATIAKSLTVDAAPGVVAFNARTLNVNLTANDTVTLRHLTLNGAVFGDLIGISFPSGGTLNLESCDISGFQDYAVQQLGGGTLNVNRSSIHGAPIGNGIYCQAGAGTGRVAIAHSSIHGMGAGVFVFAKVSMSITDSEFSGNDYTINVQSTVTGANATVSIDRSVITGSGSMALSAVGGNGGAARIYVSSSSINGNFNTVQAGTSGTGSIAAVISFGNNAVSNNTTTTPFSTTVPAM